MDIESIFFNSDISSDSWKISPIFTAERSFDPFSFLPNNAPLIGIIDTGFAPELLQERESSIQLGFDWVDGDSDPLTGMDALHGTAIAQQMDDASLWLGRAVDPRGGNWAASLVEFTNTAISQGRHGIANLSFEVFSQELSGDEWSALEYASERGIAIVTAAGNTPGNIGALGRASLQFDNFLTVGALNADGSVALNSSSGKGLDLVAYGGNGNFFGTSLAAANVSQAVEKLWAANPHLDASAIASVLKTSATDLNLAGWDANSGYGALNLEKALESASNYHNIGSAQPYPLLSLKELGVLDVRSFTNPLFEVVGSKIYDASGVEFIAKGVNINGPGFGWPGDTVGYADEIVDRWGFNAIRLNVQQLEPSSYVYEENGTIPEIVQAYTSRGAVVVIEAHENTGDYFVGEELDNLVAWWREQAKQFKDNPYVWFNVSNEPGDLSSSDPTNVAKWVDQNQRVINAVRSEGANNIVVVDGHYWGQDAGEWNASAVEQSKSALLGYSNQLSDPNQNLVFSVHLYDQWAYGDGKMADYFDRLRADKIPFIIGEYGATKDGSFQSTVTSMFNTAVSQEIGRFAWAWWGGDDFELTTSGNGGGQYAQYDSQGNITNLSWFGQQVLADNRRVEDLDVLYSAPPSLSIDNVSIKEGDSGTAIARFTVALSAASDRTITVDYATADGTAIATSDYSSAKGSLTFNPGQTRQTIDVRVVGDTLFEADETFFLKLFNSSNATLASDRGQATISNDDAVSTLASVSVDDLAIVEGDTGKPTLQFTVKLSNASSETISLNYVTSDGTAKHKKDFIGVGGTLTFNPGQTTRTIAVKLKNDTIVEGDENFFLNLSNLTNATFAKERATVTIIDNDGKYAAASSNSQMMAIASSNTNNGASQSQANSTKSETQSLSVSSLSENRAKEEAIEENDANSSETDLDRNLSDRDKLMLSFLPLWNADDPLFLQEMMPFTR